MPVTPGPDDLAARVRALETRLNELARGTLSNAVISSGGITIQDLGGITLTDRDGETVFFVGGIGDKWSRPDGTPQPVTSISDDRGRWRIAVFDSNPAENGYRQFVAIWDYSGNIILGDDVNAGEGLARPYIPYTVARARYTEWAATTSGSWDTLETLRFNRQHARLDVHVRVTSDNPDTAGEVALFDDASGALLASRPVEYVIATHHIDAPCPGAWGDVRELRLAARRTRGSGGIRATAAYAGGQQSWSLG